MDCEGTIIVSCDTLTPADIICKILGVESLPESVASGCPAKGYPWSFKNKYYSSKINLYALAEKAELNSDFCDSIKAVIFYFDSQKQSSFDDVVSWLPFLKDINAEVQLLLCDNCLEENSNPDLERKNVLKWCAENQYELVELNPIPDSEEDEEAFEGAKGYDRVIEALQSYTWANLVMKEETASACAKKQSEKKEEMASACAKEQSEEKEETASACAREQSEEKEETASACAKEQSDEKSATPNKDGWIKIDTQNFHEGERWLNNLLCVDDPAEDVFEEIFEKFASMKETASRLHGEERKKYAEEVVIAFWKSLGLDEDEIAGLDSDSDE